MPSSTDDGGRANTGDREAAALPRETPARATLPHEARGYETRDANTHGVLGFLAVLFLVINLVLFGSWLLFRHFSVAERPPAPASPFATERQVPPAPDLQVNGREDFQKIYAEQQQELETYSWEDRKAGIVRIPIQRAMDLLLEKGLPVLPSGTAGQSTAGNVAPKKRVGGSSTASAAFDKAPGGGDQ
jgi:hypothetical protein